MKPLILLSVTLAALSVVGCSGLRYEGNIEKPDSRDRWRQEQGSILGEGGLTTVIGGESARAKTPGVVVNSYLWRAALDTMAFMPLAQVDPFGGVIITDWHSPVESPNERFKMTAYILSPDLESNGIRVALFRETRDATGGWYTAAVARDAVTKLEDAILTRARALRISLERQPG